MNQKIETPYLTLKFPSSSYSCTEGYTQLSEPSPNQALNWCEDDKNNDDNNSDKKNNK